LFRVYNSGVSLVNKQAVKGRKMDTQRAGTVSELAVATRLMEVGYEVAKPYNAAAPYDLIFITESSNGWFRSAHPLVKRVQCKTARYVERDSLGTGGYLVFNGYSNGGKSGRGRSGYWGKADYFGVYCGELRKVYLLPVQAFPNGREIRLRVKASRNNQEDGVVWARDYEV
jgi:hypothetical protein